MLSYEWDRKAVRGWAFLPTRGRIERGIAKERLDTWAASYGYPLALERPAESDRPLKRRWAARTNRRQIARSFLLVDKSYEGLLRLREDMRVWVASQSKLANSSAGSIAATRNHLFFAGDLLRDATAYFVCEAMLLMAQGIFVATHETREVPIFPTREFLRRYLQRTGGDEWLERYAATMPEWLSLADGG